MEDRAAPEDADALARDHRRIVRLHLAAWGVLLLITAVSAAVLGTELWTPDPTLRIETYTRAVHVHQITGFAVLLAPVGGVAGMLVVPARLGRSGLRWQWLAYIGLVGYLAGALILLFAPDTIAFGIPGSILGIATLVAGLACVAFMLVIELVAERSRWNRAPLLVFGIGLGCTLQLLAFARSGLQFLGPRFGVPTLGSGLDYLMPLTYPVALGVAGDMLQRCGGRPLPRWAAMTVIVVLAVTPWMPGHPLLHVPAGVAAPLALLGAALASRRPVDRANPRWIAAMFVVVFVASASWMSAMPYTIALDIHLRDTYFVPAIVHATAAAGLFAILALLFDQPTLVLGRTPRARLGTVGLVVLGLGCTGLFVAHAGLGTDGMPRHYYTYIPQFTAMHVVSIIAGIVAGIGLLLVTPALWGRPCARSDASQGT